MRIKEKRSLRYIGDHFGVSQWAIMYAINDEFRKKHNATMRAYSKNNRERINERQRARYWKGKELANIN